MPVTINSRDDRPWMEVLAERRKHLDDTAKCQCGTDQATCEAGRKGRAGPEGLCCSGGSPGHGHVRDQRAIDALLREIANGEVRTVAELKPPPVLGPSGPTYAWLLGQAKWWYPHRRPAILIAEMDKPHRWNTARWLERRAGVLHESVGMQYMHGAPDDVWTSYLNENVMEWLHSQPLLKALNKGLPRPGTVKGDAMAARAVHWNTCPMRRAHPGRYDRCLCVQDGTGRTIGATNDPATVTA